MTALIGPLINTLLSLVVGTCIRLYLLGGKLRVSVRSLCGIYAGVFLLQCVVFVSFREYFAADYTGNQVFKTLSGALHILIPFLVTRGGFFQKLFLISAVTHYIMVIFGAGNCVELAWGGAFAEQHPYLVCDGVVILLSVPLLPFTLRSLKRLFGLLPDKRALVWKYIWIIPILFAVLCMMAANIFMGEDAVSIIFVIGRIFTGVGMIVTCYLLARTLRQEADNARLSENARMTERQLNMQREQYERLMESAEMVKSMRHDMCHHLAALSRLADSGDAARAKEYIQNLSGPLSASKEESYCANYAANAVAAHYLSLAESEDITVEARLHIPEDTGRIPAMDICVILGNFLENALEACRRMERGDRFIRVDSDTLSIVMTNSFDGLWNEKNGVYLSRKESEEAREGVGLSSVRAVCEKYRGLTKFEVTGGVWKSSALMHMGDAACTGE